MPRSDNILPPRRTAADPPPPLSTGKKGALAALVGATAAAGLFLSIPQDEGSRNVAYRDIVGVWTICQGDTKDVRPGQVASDAECQERLERQLLAHAKPVLACTPSLTAEGRDYQRWAAISLAYNIGPRAYCNSSIDKYFDRGQWRRGCDRFLVWNKAGGREIRGLTERRKRERAICLKGLA